MELKFILHAFLASALLVCMPAAAKEADKEEKLCSPVCDLEWELIVVCVEQCLHHKRYGTEIGARFRDCVTEECTLTALLRNPAP